MKVEWTCCFCEQKESFIAPGDDLVSASAEEEEAEEEEGYLLCTCCEKQSTWFHANKETCLQRLRERRDRAITEEDSVKVNAATAAAARVQTAHKNVQWEESQKRGGESYFFYNCEKCSALECFGCKKASLTRKEPHNIGTLRASLCAVCGEKASCSSRKYKSKNYTRGIDSDVYLCSSVCEKKFGQKTKRGSPANKTVKLDSKQTRIINNAIKRFEKESIEQFKQRWQSLSKWLKYFEKRVGDDGEEEIVPTRDAKQDLTRLIPSEVHFDTLMNSVEGISFQEGKTDEENGTRGTLLVDHIKYVVSATVESERDRMKLLIQSEKDLTEEQKTKLAMTRRLVGCMDDVGDGLRKGTITLENILVLAENNDAVGIGGNGMLKYYESNYLAAKDVEASEDQYMEELKSQIASFEAQRDNLKAASAPIRDSLYKKLRNKIKDGADTGADTVGEDDDAAKKLAEMAEQFSFFVLNKPVWPIVHQERESAPPVCVKVNFWQWAWYHEHRTLKDEATEESYLRVVNKTFNPDVIEGEDAPEEEEEEVQEETIEDSDAVEETKVENVEQFKAYFYTLKKTWQEKHFTLRGRDQSKVLTLDAVPLEWLSRPDDSDEEMEDADGSGEEEEEDAVMQDADGKREEEDQVVEESISQELIDQTAKHFEICVSALNKRYNTSVVPSSFKWLEDEFPTSIPFDEFAMEDASKRAKDAIEELVQKALPKLKECSDAYRTVYTSLCSGKKDAEEASHKEKQDAVDTQVKKIEEEFDKVKKMLQDKNTQQNGKKCFAFVMSNNALFNMAKTYFASAAEMSAKVKTFMDTCRASYNKGVEIRKVNFAWELCKKKFERKKEKYGMQDPGQNLSFAGYLKTALKLLLKQLSEERAAILKEKEKNRVAFMKFLADFIDDQSIADTKKEGKLAKKQLRDFLHSELDKLYVKYTMYYDGESANDDIDSWFPMLSYATKANRERFLMDTKEYIAEAKLFESDLDSMMSAWEASIEKEADEEKDRELAEEEKRCFKYFKPNLQPKLIKEKDNILKAYGRHTIFHHLGHASFADCGKAAKQLGYKMNRGVFAEWETRSLEKYMKYYRKRFKKFNPDYATTTKEKERLKKLNIYNEKEAEEGRQVALAQIREAAVMRWRKQIIEFKAAWKEFDYYEHKSGVPKSQIRRLDSSRSIRKGDKVEAKCTGWTESEFYNGEITSVNSNGTFDIKFDKLEKCRKVLYETFCTTGWMQTEVRKNERTTKGLTDAYVDEWRYKDRKEENRNNYMLKKQPTIFETKDKQTGKINPDGEWDEYAEDDAIFGVKPGDEDIRGNQEKYLIQPAGGDEMSLDVMAATYCPECGLATFSDFTVYDQPYSGYFPDRNMYPNARFDNKNLQFCGIGDEYETNKKLIDRAKFHFAVHVGLRERYVKDLAKFTTRQFVTLGSTQCETLPNGGCLQAFTRKQAVDGLNDQKATQASKILSTSWKMSFENWETGLQKLTTPELKQKHANFFRVDVRLPLWQGRKVRAPPGYRLVQYPNKGWTWQLEPFFDPLQTLLLQVEEGIMQWHPEAPNSAFRQELQSLSALCQSVGANMDILHNIESFQCEDQSWRRRLGKSQFVAGDKPYAWLLPVAPAVNAEEDNKLNDVRSNKAKVARAQLGFAKGTVKSKEWVPDAEEALTWYIEDVAGDASLVRRLELRRNTFLAQQRQVMKRCQTELSRYLIRRKIIKLTSLYKSKTRAFVGEKMDAYSNLSFLHKEYKFNERPNKKSAAAPPEEVAAWMISVLTGKPLRMYECKRSGKPCIYVESRKNNVTAESVAACAHASRPENTMHFATKQQYDIEADKFVQKNLKRCLQKKVRMFDNVLNELGREIRLDRVEIDSDDESGSGSDSGSDSGSGDDEESEPEEDDEDKPEGVTKEMKNDGWEYDADWGEYHRKQQDDRDEMYTSQKPMLWKDGKYYAWEEIDQKERGEPAGGGAEDRSQDDGNDSARSSFDEEEMSDSDLGGDKDDGSKADGGDGGDSDESDSDGSDSDGAARSPAEMSVSEVIEQRVPGYIKKVKELAAPREREAYEPQFGARCAIHAANNFLELEERDRFTLEHFQELEPATPLWDGLGGFAIDTIGKIFETKRQTGATQDTHEDYCISLSSLENLPEEQWNDMRSDPNYLGFIAKPATAAVLEEEKDRAEEIPRQAKMAGLEITILFKVKDFFTNHLDDFEEENKSPVQYFMQEAEKKKWSRLNNDERIQRIAHLVSLARDSVLKGQLQTAITELILELQTYRQRAYALIRRAERRQRNRNDWHWLAIRKYADYNFFIIDSKYGRRITPWGASYADFKRDFSKQKLMIFATPQRAQQWRDELAKSSYSDNSGKRMWALARQPAKDRLKTLFNMSDEESDDLLGSGDEDSDSDSSSGGAAAQRPTKRRKTGALFRMLRDMYI